ncbi:hypothetical protein [Actinoplanes sp. NBRC 103695]|uniref:hypothetical protein n=1 Tax=Actinoplanes sp. NBRC 103695 TaxID=3032202 RepID=UPI002555336D|nr:hypothetical protein [Actinoplanes sp. NBRC 103695]
MRKLVQLSVVERRQILRDFVDRALADGIKPESEEGREIVNRIVEPTLPSIREALTLRLELLADASLERFWTLASVLQGREPGPSAIPAFQWLLAGLRAHH